MFQKTLFMSLLFFITGHANALTVVVDGNLDEWLHTPTGVTDVDWTNVKDANINISHEDQTGGRNTYLNPGYGGQAYDAEAIYVEKSNGLINIAIVTGLAPSEGKYPSGDIALDFGLDGSYEFGIVTLGDATGIGTAGQVYRVNEWNYGLWTEPDQHNPSGISAFKSSHPTTVESGELLGTYALKYAAYAGDIGLHAGDQHYVIETSIPMSVLMDLGVDTNKSFYVHWTMACANDYLMVDPPAGNVPTPAPFALMLLGLLPLFRFRAH